MESISDAIDVSALISRMNDIVSSVSNVSGQVSTVNRKVEDLQTELQKLREDFEKMVLDQKKDAVMQRAISELVRVRQEITQTYGSYSVCRQTMLGIIQATDSALVRKATISRVSEELMIQTPQYWLAPCVVAIAAWISNDRPLAERAIREAISRDEEKTAIAMALICRRNGRIDTCFEWLSVYFSYLDADAITEEAFTYIDAYINGVFGVDAKHMCQGYVAKWISEIQGKRKDFEHEQELKWADYCRTFKIDARRLYPALAETVQEFPKINAAIGCINSFGPIRDAFQAINSARVDQAALRKSIDEKLVHLINQYDKAEVTIRREEEYLTLLKHFEGDEEKAKLEMLVRERNRQQPKLDFIEQMSKELTIEGEAKASASKKKTALSFLASYINRGYEAYVKEDIANFPDSITIKLSHWTGTASTGEEADALCGDYTSQMERECNHLIALAKASKHKGLLNGAIVCFVSTVILLFSGRNGIWAGVLAGIAGTILLIVRSNKMNHTDREADAIRAEYQKKIDEGKKKITDSLSQWRDVRASMNEYMQTDHVIL